MKSKLLCLFFLTQSILASEEQSILSPEEKLNYIMNEVMPSDAWLAIQHDPYTIAINNIAVFISSKNQLVDENTKEYNKLITWFNEIGNMKNVHEMLDLEKSQLYHDLINVISNE